MSESKTECPICHRQPGERHQDACKRSMRYMRAFGSALKMRKRMGIMAWEAMIEKIKKAQSA